MFDSKLLYLCQTLLIAGTLFLFVRRQSRLLQLQVITWCVAVIGIVWRYGTEGQLGFYSNDQLQYAAIVRILTTWQWAEGESASLFWWTEYSKIPYPASAVPLALAGVHFALALKTVSIVCLLALSHGLLQRYANSSLLSQTKVAYLTGCGLIGSFFSVLALRESMMMYFVYRYIVARSITGKILAISVLFLLRSHLAAAIIVAELVLSGWDWMTRRSKLGFLTVPILLVGGVTVGYTLFNLRFNNIQGYGLGRQLPTPFNGNFGIKETSQVASNFAGLQFLTSHEAFVRLSISDLLLLRILLSETILIPLGFTIAFILFGNSLNRRQRFTVLVFCVYIGIVTNTDFNSFRQNIPLMPLMGMMILDFLRDRRQKAVDADERIFTTADRPPIATRNTELSTSR
jgi:hypothetical protein